MHSSNEFLKKKKEGKKVQVQSTEKETKKDITKHGEKKKKKDIAKCVNHLNIAERKSTPLPEVLCSSCFIPPRPLLTHNSTALSNPSSSAIVVGAC
jgi:hypothetical protein